MIHYVICLMLFDVFLSKRAQIFQLEAHKKNIQFNDFMKFYELGLVGYLKVLTRSFD